MKRSFHEDACMPETSISPAPEQTRPSAIQRATRVLQSVAFGTAWISSIFLCAGTLHWTRGWIFVSIYIASMAVLGLAIHRFNPGLIQARMKVRHKDTEPFDKGFTAAFVPLGVFLPCVAGLDVVRFHRPSMPVWTAPLGVTLFMLATAQMGWAMAVNPWAEKTVRIQLDRGQRVVRSGPYRFVRHPMYVGALAMFPAMACMLGSVWALAPAGLIVVLLLWRTAKEDSVLRRELPGYEEYATVTKFRLVPGIW